MNLFLWKSGWHLLYKTWEMLRRNVTIKGRVCGRSKFSRVPAKTPRALNQILRAPDKTPGLKWELAGAGAGKKKCPQVPTSHDQKHLLFWLAVRNNFSSDHLRLKCLVHMPAYHNLITFWINASFSFLTVKRLFKTTLHWLLRRLCTWNFLRHPF